MKVFAGVHREHDAGNLVIGKSPLQDPSTEFVVIADKPANDQAPQLRT